MKALLLTLVAVFHFKTLNALDIDGPFVVDSVTTWSITDSPVVVTGAVEIVSGGTISVESGVEVRFTTAESGIVNSGGTLRVLGSIDSRVSFLPSLDNMDGVWQGISFGAGASAAFFSVNPMDDTDVTYTSGSVIQYADIAFAGSGPLYPLDFSQGAAPYMLGVDIIECFGNSGWAIDVERLQGYFVAQFIRLKANSTDSTFNPQNWIYVGGQDQSAGFVLLQNIESNVDVRDKSVYVTRVGTTVLKDSTTQAVFLNQVAVVSVTENTFAASDFSSPFFSSYLGLGSVDNSRISIVGNTFVSASSRDSFYADRWRTTPLLSEIRDNEFRNGRFRFRSFSVQNLIVSSNTISDSANGAIYMYGDQWTVGNNTITQCSSPSNPLLYLFHGGGFGTTADFSGNFIETCSAPILVNLRGSFDSSAVAIFEQNEFFDCVGGEDLIHIEDYPFSSVSKNVFENSTATTSVRLDLSSSAESGSLVPLPMNYWGSFQDDVTDLRTSIVDGFTTIEARAVVDFQSVLTGPSLTSVIQEIELPQLFLSDGSIGGILIDGTFTLPPGTYTCSLSLFVKNATFNLQAGTSIEFAPLRGISVLSTGTLTASGSADLPIRLKNSTAMSSWSGILLGSDVDSTFSHVSIEHSNIGIDHFGIGSLTLDPVSVIYCEGDCVRSRRWTSANWNSDGNNFTIVNSHLSRCGGNGVNVHLRSNVFVGNASIEHGGGIYFDRSVVNVEVSGSILRNVDRYAINTQRSFTDGQYRFVDNEIDSSAGGVLFDCYYCSLELSGNLMSGGEVERSSVYPLFVRTISAGRLYIVENQIEAWRISNLAAMVVYFSTDNSLGSGLELQGNTFRNIEATNILDISYASTTTSTNISSIFAENLTVTSSTSPAWLVVNEWPDPTEEVESTLSGNIFIGIPEPDQFYIQVRQESTDVPEIDASASFWSSDQAEVIVSRIVDGRDDPSFSRVLFNPFLETPGGPLITDFVPFLQGNVLSGILPFGESLVLSSGNYSSQGSLVIDGTLTLNAGVSIRVDAGAFISIGQGSLIAVATYDEPIQFERLISSEAWGQIVIQPSAMENQTVLMENVVISGAGASSVPAMSSDRPGSYVNVTVKDCSGGGISVAGTGAFSFEGLSVEETVGGSTGFLAGGSADVILHDCKFFSQCSSSEILASELSRLTMESVIVQPSGNSIGLYFQNRYASLDAVVYDSRSSFNSYAMYVDTRSMELQVRNSMFNVTGTTTAVYLYDRSYQSSTVVFRDNYFDASSGFLVQAFRLREATLEGNVFGSTTAAASFRGLAFSSCRNLSVRNNTMENLSCINGNCIEGTATGSFEADDNIFLGLDAAGGYHVLSATAPSLSITGNRWDSCSGYGLIEFDSPMFANLTTLRDNVVASNTNTSFVLATKTQLEDVQAGIYYIGPNFWGTVSFDELRSKTFDSQRDASLASIVYTSIFADDVLETEVVAPPSGSIVDPDLHTISGSIFDGATISVPAGIYYAPGSITLQHPEATLILEAGVRIMFAQSASFRVVEGALQIQGNPGNLVELTSIDRLIDEFGNDGSIESTTSWVGVWLGQYSNAERSFLRGCSISNAGRSPLSASVYLDRVTVPFENVMIVDSLSRGLYAESSSSDIEIAGMTILGANGYGIYFYAVTGSILFESLNITGSTLDGVYLDRCGDTTVTRARVYANGASAPSFYRQIFWEDGSGGFSIRDSIISEAGGLGLVVSRVRSATAILIVENVEFRDCERALDFNGIYTSSFRTNIFVSLSSFTGNSCSSGDCNAIQVRTYGNIVFQGNELLDNIGSSIAALYVSTPFSSTVSMVEVTGNIFRRNRAASSTSGEFAVLEISSDGDSDWAVMSNEFGDDQSPFEISTFGFTGANPASMTVNATNNFFTFAGMVDESDIENRVFDNLDDPSLPEVVFVPFLASNFTPECEADCSNQGTCIFPGYCVCGVGWSGEICNIPTCQAIGRCSGNGVCAGFDNCNCTQGWLGNSCDVADCSERNDCNGNGECKIPNTCTCDVGHTGQDCNECVANYRLVEGRCRECPLCFNGGSCDEEAKCSCLGPFAGDTCQECLDDFFGPLCLPLAFITRVTPNDALEVGGTPIRVRGVNLGSANISSAVSCVFSSVNTEPAVFVDVNVIECFTPTVVLSGSGTLVSSLQVMVDGELSFNSVPFTFYGLCPETACLNGFCTFGRCQCFYGYTGESCDEILVAPKIAATGQAFSISEGSPFEYQLVLSAGSMPVEWSLANSNLQGLAIDAQSGTFTWESPLASTITQTVRVYATNSLTSGFVDLLFDVSPSYIVKVSTSTVSRRRPSPSFPFTIETIDAVTGQRVGDTLANLWVRGELTSSASRRKILVRTNSQGVFSRSYQPYGNDVGRYLYGGEHPDYENTTVQGEFSIRGIDVLPRDYYFQGFPGENATLNNVFTMSFVGGTFTDLLVTVVGAIEISVNTELSATAADDMSTVTLSLTVSAETAVAEQLSFVVRSAEGDSARFFSFVDIRDRSPKFRVSPSSLDVDVPRSGEIVYRDVVLENIGSRASGPVEIEIPDQPILRSVAGDFIAGLDVDEQRVVSFSFSANEDLALGDFFFGNLVLSADGAGVSLNYRSTVVSTVQASLTVVTENEATYFDESQPNLADANVRVRSLSEGTTMSASSGLFGNVTFPDLVEGIYEITVQKLKHRSFRSTIVLESPGQTVLAFLQAEVVSYTFTVIPVEVVDSYVIEIESTFETFVPKPAVIWDPAIPDWEAIRSGLVDEIQLTGTNVGLIAAENVTLTWAREWGPVEFVFPPDLKRTDDDTAWDIGLLPANSSITIPIQVKGGVAFEVPDDRRLIRRGNNGILIPLADDPIWEEGPTFTILSGDDPEIRQSYVKYFPDGRIEYVYDVSDSTLYTIVYEGLVPVSVNTTNNAAPPNQRRELSLDFISSERRLICFDVGAALVNDPCKYLNLLPGTTVIGILCSILSKSTTSLRKLSNNEATAATPAFLAGYFFLCGVPRGENHDFGGAIDALDQSVGPTLGSDCSPGGSGSGGPSGPSTNGGGGSFRGGNGCSAANRRRRLDEDGFNELEFSKLPQHRDLQTECQTCSDEELRTLYRTINDRGSLLLSVDFQLQNCVDEALASGGVKNIFPCILSQVVEHVDMMPLARDVTRCELDRVPCLGDLSNKPGQLNLLIQSGRMLSLTELYLLPFGGSLSRNTTSSLRPLAERSANNSVQIEMFRDVLVDVIRDGSENGEAISSAEKMSLLGVELEALDSTDIQLFIDLWNGSLEQWQNGNFSSSSGDIFDLSEADSIAQKFSSDRGAVRREGFSGFGDAYLNAVEGQQFEEARALAGVCANVRVKIEQELTLTRIGFEARLEISNDGPVPLTDLSVTLRVNPFNNFTEDSTELFVFGDPQLDEVTSVDGEGVLPAATTGRVVWLILPLTEAAPQFDTKYDIGGILLYTIDGVEYIQNLAPDTVSQVSPKFNHRLTSSRQITVMPDPQLYLTYFHSRNVYSDDPFTAGVVEPAIPYQLGLLIENRGFGEARNVKIASSQPEIIENEKGLLADFTIIGSRLGNEPTAETLNIDFGTLPEQSNTIGVWDMVSTLRGTFSNFSATFEYNGPIDDDRLSLIDSVEIYELSHLVRITGEHPSMPNSLGYIDDDLDDFLVNLFPDAFYLPDTVFTSDTRQSNFSVSRMIDRATTEDPVFSAEGDVVTVLVRHNLTGQEQSMLFDWVYIRFDDPMEDTGYILQTATRTDVDYTLITQRNSWQTAWTDYLVDGEDMMNYIHLFDFGVAPEYLLSYARQQAVENLVVTDASINSITVAWDPASGASSSYVVIKPSALGDEYYKVARSFTQVNSLMIGSLAQGTEFSIKVFTGDRGNYEKVGTFVIGSTTGTSLCGNNVIDIGEECDEGSAENGSVASNCTVVCVNVVEPIERMRPPSPSPTASPSSQPSASPSSQPSASPSSQPSPTPKTGTGDSPTVEPSASPSSQPSPTPKTTAGDSPTVVPSASPSADPSSHPSDVPSGSPSAEPGPSPMAPVPSSPQCSFDWLPFLGWILNFLICGLKNLVGGIF